MPAQRFFGFPYHCTCKLVRIHNIIARQVIELSAG